MAGETENKQTTPKPVAVVEAGGDEMEAVQYISPTQSSLNQVNRLNEYNKKEAEKEQVSEQKFGKTGREKEKQAVDEAQSDVADMHRKKGTFTTIAEKTLGLVNSLDTPKTKSDIEKNLNSLMEWVNSADEKDIDPDSAVASFMKWAKGFGYEQAVPKLQGYINYYNKVNELRTALRNEVLSGYMDSNGNFTTEGIGRITDEAKSTTQKSNVQNDRLKSLQAQGPTQQALPEFPKEDAKILAKVISGGIAQIMKGISLSMAPSDRSAAVGAIMADPGIQIMSGVAPMLAADIAGYEERKQAIEDKNILLLEQYNGRIDDAMAAFDRESNAAEREYVQMVNNSIYQKMDRLYKVFDYEKALILEEGKIRASMYDEVNKAEYFNTGEANQYSRTLMTLANEVRISASRVSRAQKKNGLPDYSDFIMNNIAPMQLISSGISSTAGALNEIAAWKEQNKAAMEDPQNKGTIHLGRDIIPANYIQNTGRLIADGEMSVDEQRNLDSIIIPRLASGYYMVKNTTPEALRRLAKAPMPNSAGEFAVVDSEFSQAFNDVMMANVKVVNGKKTLHSGYRVAGILAADGIIVERLGQANTLAKRMVKEKNNSKETVDNAYRVIVKGE